MMESLPVEMRRMILDYLSNAELLTIARVNKMLSHEAYTLLRDRGNLMAVLNCGNLRPFLSHYQKFWEGIHPVFFPFSGFKICWSERHHREVCPRPNKTLDDFDIGVLYWMPLKRLSVQFSSGQYLPKMCPVFQLVKKILQDYSGGIEELELSERLQLFDFIREVIRVSTFPCLKTVKLVRWSGRRVGGRFMNTFSNFTYCKEELIREIKARAPNLQDIKEVVEPDI